MFTQLDSRSPQSRRICGVYTGYLPQSLGGNVSLPSSERIYVTGKRGVAFVQALFALIPIGLPRTIFTQDDQRRNSWPATVEALANMRSGFKIYPKKDIFRCQKLEISIVQCFLMFHRKEVPKLCRKMSTIPKLPPKSSQIFLKGHNPRREIAKKLFIDTQSRL